MENVVSHGIGSESCLLGKHWGMLLYGRIPFIGDV